jgi:hypothetical protein
MMHSRADVQWQDLRLIWKKPMIAAADAMGSDAERSTAARLVVAHQGAVGDFLLMAPVLEGLCRIHSRIRIDLWSNPEHAALLSARPYAGSVHPSGGVELAPFFHENLWVDAPIPDFFQDASAILIFGQESGRILGERLGARLSSPVHWVRSFPPPGCMRHASLYVAGQLREMGWPVEAEPLRLDPLPDAAREVDAWLAGRGLAGSAMRPLLIHVGSGGKRKIWPLSKWWGFLEQVRREFSVPLVLTLGPADERLVEFASEARARFGAHVVSNAPLTWVAALAAASAAYVGSDSGISHLAASMGARSVVIFGPTAPQVWAPRGRCVHIVQSVWEEEDVFAWSPDDTRSPIDAPVYDTVAALLRT